jgi:hypothetical protein
MRVKNSNRVHAVWAALLTCGLANAATSAVTAPPVAGTLSARPGWHPLADGHRRTQRMAMAKHGPWLTGN